MDDCDPHRLSDPLRVREVYNSVLLSRQEEYSSLTDLRVGIVTFNVAETLPDACECQKLLQMEEPHDVVAVTLQEVDMTPWAVAMEVTEWGPLWTRRVANALSAYTDYALIYEQQLVGTLLLIFVRRELHQHVHRVQAAHFRAGWLWYATTKGGIVVRFTLLGRRFIFCAQHLTPHPEGFEARCNEYLQSVATATFRQPMWADDLLDLMLPPGHPLRVSLNPYGTVGTTPLDASSGATPISVDAEMADYFFWFGDLNFRVDIEYDAAVAAIVRGDLQPLRAADQLLNGRQAGRCFVGFNEGPLNFPPTYKFDKGTTTYDTSYKRRTPSWTDRVLWACPAMPTHSRRDAGVDGKSFVQMATTKRSGNTSNTAACGGGGGDNPIQQALGVEADDETDLLLAAPGDKSEDTSCEALSALPAGPEIWLEQTFYGVVADVLQSDHRPVCARFKVRGRQVDLEQLDTVLSDAAKRVASSALSDVPSAKSSHFDGPLGGR
eukprot:GGOE01040913.1.p1 GENE.GGOE01040913.1~~GGOE01040913.1.p1  ORF type:complete len:500 (-),score=107.83 GGOE01040913.1:259-1737(-)